MTTVPSVQGTFCHGFFIALLVRAPCVFINGCVNYSRNIIAAYLINLLFSILVIVNMWSAATDFTSGVSNVLKCVINKVHITYLLLYLLTYLLTYLGPGVAQWLRHCATSRKVPGSNLSGRDFCRGYRQNHVPWGRLSL